MPTKWLNYFKLEIVGTLSITRPTTVQSCTVEETALVVHDEKHSTLWVQPHGPLAFWYLRYS